MAHPEEEIQQDEGTVQALRHVMSSGHGKIRAGTSESVLLRPATSSPLEAGGPGGVEPPTSGLGMEVSTPRPLINQAAYSGTRGHLRHCRRQLNTILNTTPTKPTPAEVRQQSPAGSEVGETLASSTSNRAVRQVS
jgi:hypothetical protein